MLVGLEALLQDHPLLVQVVVVLLDQALHVIRWLVVVVLHQMGHFHNSPPPPPPPKRSPAARWAWPSG
jgi:hypothetical protein